MRYVHAINVSMNSNPDFPEICKLNHDKYLAVCRTGVEENVQQRVVDKVPQLWGTGKSDGFQPSINR